MCIHACRIGVPALTDSPPTQRPAEPALGPQVQVAACAGTPTQACCRVWVGAPAGERLRLLAAGCPPDQGCLVLPAQGWQPHQYPGQHLLLLPCRLHSEALWSRLRPVLLLPVLQHLPHRSVPGTLCHLPCGSLGLQLRAHPASGKCKDALRTCSGKDDNKHFIRCDEAG
jgi:hypothetical protein